MTTADPITEARAHLAAGDARAAFLALRPAIVAWREPLDDAEFTLRFALFASIAKSIAGEEFAARVRAIAADPDNVQALYDAGYALYEQRLFDIAATVLLRANRLAPGQKAIVTELSANLEACMAYDVALLALGSSGLGEHDPLCAYLLGFNAMMCGDRETARAALPRITGDDETMRTVRESLASMLARADAIDGSLPLDDRELTGWHAAINGTVLLHESPHGLDAGMNGRYAFVGDSPGLMREGIERLAVLLSNESIRPARVVAAPDRASKILAHAVGTHLRLPVSSWQAGGAQQGLHCCWDLDAVGDAAFLQAMRHHTPGQILFAHISNWVSPFPYAPDVTTILAQQSTNPFTGGAMRIDPETQKFAQAEPDARDDAQLADEILTANITDPSHRPVDVALGVTAACRALDENRRLGLHRTQGHRARQRAGGPVRSNWFR
jgi:hypothetical protein